MSTDDSKSAATALTVMALREMAFDVGTDAFAVGRAITCSGSGCPRVNVSFMIDSPLTEPSTIGAAPSAL
jgi:hypothetical protein